jgi:hypothetical protein
MISIGQAFFLQESLPFHVPSLLTLLLYHLSFFLCTYTNLIYLF